MEYFSYFSFIIFKMLFFIFWPLPEKLLDCPKKNYFIKLFCPTLGAAGHTPMWLARCMCSHTDADGRWVTPRLIDTNSSRTAVQLEAPATPEVDQLAAFTHAHSAVARRHRPRALPL